MKLEPDLRLAITLQENPGVYALLIGSGVSRAAGIPTGWEITLDLARKIATASNEIIEADSETWYRSKYGEPLDYSKIIDKLATTQAERMNLLRQYFEPTPDEQQQGRKTPTIAHKVIARLVKDGFVRMILTTNFDRLTERALEEIGVSADVISSDDDIRGVLPYVHSRCTVVKLNGDYRDTRIRNTPDELATYSLAYNTLVDRILDEFGLIVCGWSGEWDTALSRAILRSPNRRFSLFWLARGELTEEAKKLTPARGGQVIQIPSADEFFIGLQEKLDALRDLNRPALSKAVAVASVKNFIVDPQRRIRLADFFREETERVWHELTSDHFTTKVEHFTTELFQERMRAYESLVDQLIAMAAALSYYDSGKNNQLLTRCVQRLLQVRWREGSPALVNVQRYPALILTYCAGLAGLAGGRFNNLAAVIQRPTYSDESDRKMPAADAMNVWNVFEMDAGKLVPRENARNEYTPANNHLFDLLRPTLKEYIPSDMDYEDAFDVFEYLLALNYLELGISDKWAPIGRHGWKDWGIRGRLRGFDSSPIGNFLRTEYQKGDFSELVENLFGRQPSRLKEVDEKYRSLLANATSGWY
jgi:hypothetical protein